MRRVLFFTMKELLIVVAVGLATGLSDHQFQSLLFALVDRTQDVVLFDFYLAHVTGGPVFGDFIQTWLEYGAVLAACLVRKPLAGTFALTVNGLCQVFVYGTHDPHLFYGFSGLGADLAFAALRFRRYDITAVSFAGISCGVFWYPIVWFTHGIYQYPVSFILSDLAFRFFGSAVGDGLLGAALAFTILRLAGRKWNEPSVAAFEHADSRRSKSAGLAMIGFGILVIAMTFAIPSVSNFFVSVGPKIPGGISSNEEYNPGYVLGVLLVFLALASIAFWNLMSRFSR